MTLHAPSSTIFGLVFPWTAHQASCLCRLRLREPCFALLAKAFSRRVLVTACITGYALIPHFELPSLAFFTHSRAAIVLKISIGHVMQVHRENEAIRCYIFLDHILCMQLFLHGQWKIACCDPVLKPTKWTTTRRRRELMAYFPDADSQEMHASLRSGL